MFGKLLSLPIKILNIAPRTAEKILDGMVGTETPKEDRILSAPLRALSDAIEEIDE